MRKTAVSAIHAGMLTSAALLLLAFGIIVIGHGARYLTGSRVFEVHFSRVNGLQPGAPVRLHGFDVGAVQSIDFPPDPSSNYMIVKVWIEREAARRLRADSLAQIETMGLLGDKYINISMGSSASPMIASGQILRSEDPVDYDAVLRGLQGSGDVVANVLAIAVSIRNMSEAIQKGNGLLHDLIYGQSSRAGPTVTGQSLREAIGTTAQAAEEIQRTFQKLNHGGGLAAALLSEKPAGRRIVADLGAAVSNLRRASETIDETSQRYADANGAIPQLVLNRAYGEQLLANLNQISTDLAQVSQKINSGKGTLGLLINNPSLYKQAQELLSRNASGISILKSLHEYFQAHDSDPADAAPRAGGNSTAASATVPNSPSPP